MSEEHLITVSEAIAIVDAAPVSRRVVRLGLEAAQGLRLAQDVVSDRDYPPFDKSLMDGFAVRCADVKTTPVELRIIGEIAAGQRPASGIAPGETLAIMTGAPMPPGADGVVPVEDILPLPPGEGWGEGVPASGSDTEFAPPLTLTLSHGERGPESRVRILRADGPHRFIAKRGADCAAGATVLSKGTRLEAAQLAVAASVGASQVQVFARPRVAVLSTGDELVAIDESPGPSQIRNSNNIMLIALLKRIGCEVTDLGIARDKPEIIRQSIEQGLQFDALFISGGMSMGHYDFVPKILLELGVDLKITKLKIKPGKPFVFGQFHQTSVFGLPGNPVSSFVCALRLASRLLLRMSGATELERFVHATLASPLESNGNREFYQPAILSGEKVQPLKWKGSADIYTLARANCLIIRPADAAAILAGQVVTVLEIPS